MAYTIQGKEVGPIGFGLMGFTWNPKKEFTDDDIFPVLRASLELGCNYWNGGEFYGSVDGENSLTLLRRYFDKYPEDAKKVLLNIKGCTKGAPTFERDSSFAGVQKSVDHSLELLGPVFGKIDQFEPARKDHDTEIEVTVKAFQEQVAAGKIGAFALSEANAASIRRAAKVGKVAAVEIELSLWNTEPLTNGVVQACAELDIPILAYSPLGRGVLTGNFKSFNDLPEGLIRQIPRCNEENFDNNLRLIQALQKIADKKGATVGQIAINWLVELGKRPDMPRIIPIPGTTSIERLRENAKIVSLSEEDMAVIDKILKEVPVVGDRLPAFLSHLKDNST